MIDDFLALGHRQLQGRLDAGFPIDPASLDNTRYRGLSLGLPAWVDRALWKTFEKVFKRDGDELRGWNVRLQQTGIHGEHRPMLKGDQPFAFGHYRVVADQDRLLLDYRVPRNPLTDPSRWICDPLVALQEDDAEWLFGRVDLHLPRGRRWGTPSFFLLQRLGPLVSA